MDFTMVRIILAWVQVGETLCHAFVQMRNLDDDAIIGSVLVDAH